MAGHSKWKQIKRKKAVADPRRAAVWTKLHPGNHGRGQGRRR